MDLKKELDVIDIQIANKATEGFYKSRVIMYIGEWEKGKEISQYRGVKRDSYEQLMNITGRDKDSLNKWNNKYEKYQDKEIFIKEYAEPKAREWAEKVLKPKVLISCETPPMIEGQYKIIYADPPWKYSDVQNTPKLGGAEKHYPLMSIEELCEMDFPKTDDNAILFLWVTSPILEESFEVINTWGFKYKAQFIWDKVKHNMGHYNSVRHELLLICTKGSCTPENKKLEDSVQSIEKTDKHSQKPEKFRDIIDIIYPTGNRVELFNRVEREKSICKWKYWGNE